LVWENEKRLARAYFLFLVMETLLLIKFQGRNIYNITQPILKKLNLENQFDIIVLVKGGGLTGQTDAIKLGVARLICKMNPQNRSILKPFGLLTRDARIKERKKYGLRKARKAPQYSKR